VEPPSANFWPDAVTKPEGAGVLVDVVVAEVVVFVVDVTDEVVVVFDVVEIGVEVVLDDVVVLMELLLLAEPGRH
jgi:hypothetical protein